MLKTLLILQTSAGQHVVGEIILIVICVLMSGYLLAALLWPEKF